MKEGEKMVLVEEVRIIKMNDQLEEIIKGYEGILKRLDDLHDKLMRKVRIRVRRAFARHTYQNWAMLELRGILKLLPVAEHTIHMDIVNFVRLALPPLKLGGKNDQCRSRE